MLGTYRLALALMVALSHVGLTIAGLNPGVMAVAGFYLVSGYVMTGLLRTHYAGTTRIGAFFADRALRLYPHYLAIAALTLAAFLLLGLRTPFLAIEPSAADLARNLAIVPLNFYMFNHADRFTLIPPAWSLGAEVQFYLIVPFLLLGTGARFRDLAIVSSVIVFLFAAAGRIDSDYFGYRLLPGVLFVFLLGSRLYDLEHGAQGRALGWPLCIAVCGAAALVAAALAASGQLTLPYNRELLIGLCVGILALQFLSRLPRRRFDEALGALSYGVFLNHFLVVWLLFHSRISGAGAMLAYAGSCLVVAFLGYRLIERPVLRLRRKLRNDGAKFAAAGSVSTVDETPSHGSAP